MNKGLAMTRMRNQRTGNLRKYFSRVIFLSAITCFLFDQSNAAPAPANVVVIFADNMGYGDLGCYGCPDIETPVIDALAAEGVRFTNYYSNGPECTPARTAFFTGRYPQRVRGLECALGSGNVGRYDHAFELAERSDLGLPPAKNTLVRLLKEQGYTAAGFGKWHLGYEKKFLPPKHGFDYFLAVLGGTMDYFYHNEPNGTPVLYENGEQVNRDGRYLTDLITEGAIKFLREQDPEKPFFLYLPYTAPSAPLQHPDVVPKKPKVSAEWDSKDWQEGTRETYGLIVERLDKAVGEVLAVLAELGYADDALVIFASDNGGNDRARNLPFRGYTSELFDGGIHVPCIARWPGVLPAGRVVDRRFLTLDLTASLLAAAGVEPPEDESLDGIDVLGQVAAGEAGPERALFWRARRADRTWRAVRDGSMKYLTFRDGEQVDEYLFDLETDPGEQRNLFEENAGEAARLKKVLEKWEKDVESGWSK